MKDSMGNSMEWVVGDEGVTLVANSADHSVRDFGVLTIAKEDWDDFVKEFTTFPSEVEDVADEAPPVVEIPVLPYVVGSLIKVLVEVVNPYSWDLRSAASEGDTLLYTSSGDWFNISTGNLVDYSELVNSRWEPVSPA